MIEVVLQSGESVEPTSRPLIRSEGKYECELDNLDFGKLSQSCLKIIDDLGNDSACLGGSPQDGEGLGLRVWIRL